jgi:hypothetical protein
MNFEFLLAKFSLGVFRNIGGVIAQGKEATIHHARAGELGKFVSFIGHCWTLHCRRK